MSDGTSKGYISKSFDSQNSYTYGDLASAQTFSLPPTNYFNTPIDITAVNGPSPSQPLLGAVGGSGGFFFGSGQGGFVIVCIFSFRTVIDTFLRQVYIFSRSHAQFVCWLYPSNDPLMLSV